MTHNAAIRLLYIGDADDPLDQLAALYSVAAAALRLGGLGVLNERAALALPTEVVESFLPQLGTDIPPIQLWTGVLTFTVDTATTGNPTRYLLRSYGMDQCALPELGSYFTGLDLLGNTYHVLMNVCLYLVQNRHGVPMGAGDRVEFDGRSYLLTELGSDDWDAASSTGLLLLVEV